MISKSEILLTATSTRCINNGFREFKTTSNSVPNIWINCSKNSTKEKNDRMRLLLTTIWWFVNCSKEQGMMTKSNPTLIDKFLMCVSKGKNNRSKRKKKNIDIITTIKTEPLTNKMVYRCNRSSKSTKCQWWIEEYQEEVKWVH